MLRVGAEIVLEGDDEPALEFDDEIEWVINDINAWGYLCRAGRVTYTGYEVPATGAAVFAEAANALAEQYGDPARVWAYDREIAHADGTTETRRWTVTGSEFRQAMLRLAAAADAASDRGKSMTINMDD